MRFVLSKVAVLLHLVLLTVFLASGYCRPASLASYLPVILLVLALFEMVMLFAPGRRGDSVADSQARTRRKMLRDPVLYLGLAGLAFVVCQTLNGPCRFVYDAGAQTWVLQSPPLRGLPCCLNRAESFQAFFWFIPAWAGVMAIRHGLTRRAKLRLLNTMALLSGVLAVISLFQYATGRPLLLWGAPNVPPRYGIFDHVGFAGTYFGMMMLLTGGLLTESMTSQTGVVWRRILFVLLMLNLVAATFTLSYPALFFVWGGALIGLVLLCHHVLPTMRGAARLKFLAILLVTAGALAFLHFVAYPENAIHAKVNALFTGKVAHSGWAAEHRTLGTAALRIFRAHPIYGVGTWGFGHMLGQVLRDDDWRHIAEPNQEAQTCFSDPLQFLCELGVVGSGLLAAILVLLLIPVLRRIYAILRTRAVTAKDMPAARPRIISPVAAGIVMALIGALIVSLFEMPFRNPLVLLTWSMLLAALPALLPLPAAEGISSSPPDGRTSHHHRLDRRTGHHLARLFARHGCGSHRRLSMSKG